MQTRNFHSRLLILFGVAVLSQPAWTQGSKWVELSFPAPPGESFDRIDLADSLNGMLMAPDGSFIWSTDGGSSWSPPERLPLLGRPREFKLYDSKEAMVLIVDSTSSWPDERPLALLRTTNRGATWMVTDFPDTSTDSEIFSISLYRFDRIGFIANRVQTGEALFYSSSDGGQTWDTAFTSTGKGMTSFAILESDRMFACPVAEGPPTISNVYSSFDGVNWSPFLDVGANVNRARGTYFSDYLSCFNLTEGDEFYFDRRVLYNARTDSCVELNGGGTGVFYDDGSVFSIEEGGGLVSDSGGFYTMTQWSSGGTLKVVHLSTTSPRDAWVLTSEGRVFKAVGHVTTIVQNVVELALEFSLGQNYPNPFNPTTTMEYTLPHSGYVTLKVYNVLGEELATVVEGDHTVGTFKKSWDASALSSGVYFYRLTAGAFVQTRRMVVMK
jgi:hypothetical protein